MAYSAGPDIKRTLRIKVERARAEYEAAEAARREALYSHATTSVAAKARKRLDTLREALRKA